MSRPVFRFAPTPNGPLHLGHAFSAMLNHALSGETGGRFLLRIEDIDLERADPAHERTIFDDLAWLGLDWERPVRRQSGHLPAYRDALARLDAMGLVYPAFMSRGEVRALIIDRESRGERWPRDPDGAPHYPGLERSMAKSGRDAGMASGAPFAWRLDMAAAIAAAPVDLTWEESGAGPQGQTGRIGVDPGQWGDVVVARKDAPGSYHLAVVVDDAAQGVTHVVRGRDLFHATAVHRLLQALLGLPAPAYRHHALVAGPDGRKLSKSRGDLGLGALRAAGVTPAKALDRAGWPRLRNA